VLGQVTSASSTQVFVTVPHGLLPTDAITVQLEQSSFTPFHVVFQRASVNATNLFSELWICRPLAAPVSCIALGDLDRDGWPDIVSCETMEQCPSSKRGTVTRVDNYSFRGSMCRARRTQRRYCFRTWMVRWLDIIHPSIHIQCRS